MNARATLSHQTTNGAAAVLRVRGGAGAALFTAWITKGRYVESRAEAIASYREWRASHPEITVVREVEIFRSADGFGWEHRDFNGREVPA